MWQRARPLLGTLVVIGIEEEATGGDAHGAVNAAFAELERLQQLLSYHDPASELSRINRDACRQCITVSSDMWNVLRAAQRFSNASGGLFDVTVAPVLTRLGFLPRHPEHPRASRHGDWRHIALLPGRRVRLTRALRIDLGGIAKGYAVDRAVDVLRRNGVQRGSVNAGGDLRCIGPCPFTLHVRHPANPTAFVPVQARKPAAATSSDYFRHRRRHGHKVTPLVNPHTGNPCIGARSVTVLADDCMTADALTKVVYTAPESATPLLEAFHAEAVILDILETGACHRGGAIQHSAGPAHG